MTKQFKNKEVKKGMEVVTWMYQVVKVVGISRDKKTKPLIVLNNGVKQYYHFSQILAIRR